MIAVAQCCEALTKAGGKLILFLLCLIGRIDIVTYATLNQISKRKKIIRPAPPAPLALDMGPNIPS